MAWVSFLLQEAVSGPQSTLPYTQAGKQGDACVSLPTSFPSLLSRIKGWWVSHHYVSTFLSGVMLTW